MRVDFQETEDLFCKTAEVDRHKDSVDSGQIRSGSLISDRVAQDGSGSAAAALGAIDGGARR